MENKVYELFDKLDIKYDMVEHDAVFTGSDCLNTHSSLGGTIFKNLLVEDNKTKKLILVILPVDKRADLKMIASELGMNKLSFAKEEKLFENLGVRTGSASVLNIIEKPDTKVRFIIDKELKDIEKVCFHPNINTASISFDSKEVERILKHFNASYQFLKV